MAKKTLYVPDDSVGDVELLASKLREPSLSRWFIAQVKKELTAISAREKRDSMETSALNLDSVAARLRAGRDARAVEARKLGQNYGKDWAAEVADLDDLKAVATVGQYGLSAKASLDSLSNLESLAPVLNELLLHHEIKTVINSYDEAFSAGFIDGAQLVWRAVAQKL